jgi:fatty-acyl-CoA synthase
VIPGEPPALGQAPLTPVAFLEKSGTDLAAVTAVVDGDHTLTYGQLLDRCRGLTGALRDLGIRPGDRVAALCTNSALMLELHFAVPMAGAVLVPLNHRLSRPELRFLLEHSGSAAIFTTVEVPVVVEGDGPGGVDERLGASSGPALATLSESDLLAINYTSGTTGNPKGVMYLHRGAYLQSVAMAFHAGLGVGSRYLWTLPMFHCDGWCMTWALTAVPRTSVCGRWMRRESGSTCSSAASRT